MCVWATRLHLVSWNSFYLPFSMCVCESALWPLITSDVIWCDIDHVGLVKQVLQLFPAFNYFIWHLPLIKWMGMAILTQHIMKVCQRKLSDEVLAKKRLSERWSTSFVKVSGWMRADKFKRRLAFSFTVIILA